MSAISENNGAWILSPYCFCADRPWLSVSDVWGKDIDDKDNVGGGITPIFGLSKEDSALLVSLLTALAIFLLLLLLLLCLFCPCCLLCCRRMCPCCFRGKTSNKAMSRGAYGGKVVNLTAVDMRIPRVWTDGNAGFSDSELGKRRNIWQKATGEQEMEYAGTNALKSGTAQHNAWVTDYGFDHQQGGDHKRFTGMTEWNKGKKERNSEMVALNEFYHNTSKMAPPTLRHRSNSYSSFIEKLMTPRTTGHPYSSGYNNSIIQSRDIAGGDTVKHSSYDYFGTAGQSGGQAVMVMQAKDAEKMNAVLHSTANRNFTSSAVNSKTDDSVQNISTQTASTRATGYDSAVDNARAERPEVNSAVIASLATMGNNTDFLKETFVTRETCNPTYNLITEKSSYMKRVVEETETIATG